MRFPFSHGDGKVFPADRVKLGVSMLIQSKRLLFGHCEKKCSIYFISWHRKLCVITSFIIQWIVRFDTMGPVIFRLASRELWPIQIITIKLTNRLIFLFVISIHFKSVRQLSVHTHTHTEILVISMWKNLLFIEFGFAKFAQKTQTAHIHLLRWWVNYINIMNRATNGAQTETAKCSLFRRYAYNSIKRNNVIVQCRFRCI